jgi:hypothetical protein
MTECNSGVLVEEKTTTTGENKDNSCRLLEETKYRNAQHLRTYDCKPAAGKRRD